MPSETSQHTPEVPEPFFDRDPSITTKPLSESDKRVIAWLEENDIELIDQRQHPRDREALDE